MDKILTEISAGELLDKISILEIKIEKIKNPELKKQVKKEFEILNANKEKSTIIKPLYLLIEIIILTYQKIKSMLNG